MPSRKNNRSNPLDFLAGGGEMAALLRAKDWSQTPVGPIETWSASFRMMVSFLLVNRFPLLLWWGPQYISIYNDAYRPILGSKHPNALGQPVSECWHEIWHVLQPLIDAPFNGGPATWMEDLELQLQRRSFTEEAHFTVAYSPVPDETAPRGIGGVLATVHEITEKVVGERRIVILRDLGAHAAEAKTAEEACAVAIRTLANHAKDTPFALIYLTDPDGKQARLAGAAGIRPGAPASPLVIELDASADTVSGWPLAEVLRSEEMIAVLDLGRRFDGVPSGPWPDPPHTAAVVPIRSNKPHQLAGLLIAGVSSRLAFDNLYRSFFELAATQIATAIANARAHEEERRRTEALAEIDRAKTAFFSNVSHEFRTPLTLMLGPLEELLSRPVKSADDAERSLVDTAHRNGLRLLKLVNSLLDFSRIEAGRVQANFEPTDLAGYTAELASTFRSAIDQAGLTLFIERSELAEPVYVDRDMWEKIVLNLLSNAFKFTFEGEIGIKISPSADGSMAELAVRDTGSGIPEHELPHLFERFHRVEGAKARTFEGSGIGLALVQELVKLHGGLIRVRSEPGWGTAFTVAVPFGTAHLPAERIREAHPAAIGTRARAYVEEALSWLWHEASTEGTQTNFSHSPLDDFDRAVRMPGAAGSRILVADDNADMRDYVRRLLLDQGYQVEAVSDGETALAAARRRAPDLVISDIMMPVLDGFGLLRALRADPSLRELPVLLLSARAGEEARVEGIDAGADDYLTKPFSARELLARVSTNLELARIRREAMEGLRARTVELETVLETVPTGVWFTRDTEATHATGNRQAAEMLRLPLDANASLTAPESDRQAEAELRQAQKMEAVGQLTGGVAHDMNNLLLVIQSSFERIERHFSPASDHPLARALQLGLRGVDRAASLTRQLLAFARRQPLDPKPVEPNRLVSGMSDLLRRTLGETVSIETVLAGGLWRTFADPGQIENAIVNLAINARDAMPDGGRLTIETVNTYLDEAYAAAHHEVIPGQYVMIAISDTGTGMTKDVAEKAFEPFFTTKELGKGTGLGLSQVYGFVKQSGGQVKISSEPGEGTTVKIYLPRYSAPVEDASDEVIPSEIPSVTTHDTILVVEDDDDVRANSVDSLRELGYRVIQAPNGHAALLILAEEPSVRVLFTDVGLPGGMNGRQLADEARRLRSELKVVFTTGHARNAIVHHGRLDPGVALIAKPYTYAALAAKIRRALETGG